MDPDRQELQRQSRILVWSLIGGGVFMIAIGVAIAVLVTPFAASICIAGLADFWIARQFATGRWGPLAQLGPEQRAEADPSYNPYARED
jgi:hypothetical protein